MALLPLEVLLLASGTLCILGFSFWLLSVPSLSFTFSTRLSLWNELAAQPMSARTTVYKG